MSQIEAIRKLPDWNWREQSAKEIMLTGKELLLETDFMWKVGRSAVVGFIYMNYLCPPWMWFALSDDVVFGDLVDFRRLASLIPQGTLTAVEDDFAIGQRFARFYGFVEAGYNVTYFEKPYKIFRRK